MGTEIERKFLVIGDGWRAGAKPIAIRQGYLCRDAGHIVRVRTYGEGAFLTIKGDGAGISRLEFEYAVPPADAKVLLDTCCRRPLIEKTRCEVEVNGLLWVIDVFAGENDGLIVAELELTSEDQAFDLPPWIGAEVSAEPRYFNAALSERPFSAWTAEERRDHDAGCNGSVRD